MHAALHKWYFDAVTSEGDVLVGYEARVKLFAFHFSYSGLLYSKRDGTSKEYSSWRAGDGPHFENGKIRWRPHGCDAEFEWYDGAGGWQALLYNDAVSRFHWNCLTPRALCKGRIGNESFEGIGYVERMDMHLAARRLPFKELLWGRAHMGDDFLVWISWRQGMDRCWIWRKGQLIDGMLVGAMPAEIHLDENIFLLKQTRPLRNRPIYKALKGVVRLLSGGIAAGREEKVLGEIIHASSGKTGKAIYERVIWE